jgi:Multiubiquitin
MTNHETQHDNKQEKISIIIEKKQVFATKETMTGAELRGLATPPIAANRDLYLEVPGQAEDRLVGDAETIHLNNGMHFYSAPTKVNPGAR